ncbi:MAG TPA: metallophosphoesterase [Pseudonocardiaceae bacterium]|nr:metallophosphoesterase [Pseudonocardiaceae bacterium]
MTLRIAAVGDVHLGTDARGRLRPVLQTVAKQVDVLLLAGDLTRHGTMEEAHVVADEFSGLGVPVLAVLGNHDYHSDAQDDITALLEKRGVRVLEGRGEVLDVGGCRLGVAGVKGFGGGFAGKCGSAFGEPEMKAFIEHSELVAARLADALRTVEDADVLVALTHYSPVPDTLRGEPLELYPFLGAYQLAEAIDGARGGTGADLAVHGHAHFGCEQGCTPGGVRVRNVARPVIRAAYAVYELPAG